MMMTMTMMMMTLDSLQKCQKRYTMSKELRPTSAGAMSMLQPQWPMLLPLLLPLLTESSRPIQWLEEMLASVKKKEKLLAAHQLGRKLSVRPPAMLGWAPSDHQLGRKLSVRPPAMLGWAPSDHPWQTGPP